ncbi:sulfatase family protein [Cyclobacterium amurskyense]|uniref:Arylsulfatase n=1 Tax=Cyclobacterium amurskyense TaxID=320787 RepID=A0A0H4PWA2_9BACT|nr:sulfatase [Cyclobacterium amurskyense]AKP52662.1 Arylsulfatase [Cyclobacterium amurskyense]
MNFMKINVRLYWPTMLVFLLVSISSCTQKDNTTESQPNIIIFFTDDQGYADLGTYGAEGFETPNLDQLAAEGIRFTNFYVPATVCTPSRAGLLTGRYPKRSNLHEAVLFPFSEGGLSPDEYTMAEMLKEGGYTTSCIGKWHLGHKEAFMPNNQGFDEFYGVPYSNDMDNYYYKDIDFQSPPLPFYRNTELIESGPDQQYLTKKYTEEAVKQIKNRGQKPFFIYLAHNMPHTPLFASPAFKGKSKHGLYGDVIMELDWSAGEIIKTLKEEGIYENTIFIFTSDNGPAKGSAKPLRGKKAQTWEGGQRVPAIITWPSKIPKGKVSDEFVNTLDLFPTLAKISSSKIPSELQLDGIDISEFLLDPDAKTLAERPFYFYARNGELEAIRLGEWKLHLKKSIGWNEKSEGEFQAALYNLNLDIGEKDNVATHHPEIVTKLSELATAFDAKL